MNKILFYAGLVLGILLFLLAVYIFFHQNIPSVIRYFMRMGNKRLKTTDAAAINKIVFTGNTLHDHVSNEFTTPLDQEEHSEIISAVHNYATALLDADDSTTILPDLDDYE